VSRSAAGRPSISGLLDQCRIHCEHFCHCCKKAGGAHLELAQTHYKKARKDLDHLASGEPGKTPIHPQYLIALRDKLAFEDAIFTCDIGTPTVWASRYLTMNVDADAPQHAASRALLESARDASTPLYVTTQILCEFYSIVTNGRRVPKPRYSVDALNAIFGLLTFLHILPTPVKHNGWADRPASPPSCDRRRRIRFTNCRNHEGK
jgi:hypothetical protein